MELYLRNIIFGIADSLVSTVGLLAGIGFSGTDERTVILTGIVYAFVEAFSMAVGSFLSEESAEEMKGDRGSSHNAFVGAVVMFVAFVVAAFIPITPYLLFGGTSAFWASILFSVLVLFIVGLVSARIVKVSMWKRGLQTALLGGAAIVIGVIVGVFVKGA